MDASVKQLEDVRKAIRTNLDSIRSLLEQAKMLESTINSIEDATLRSALQGNLRGLLATIDELIKNTDKLFDELVEYASSSYAVS